MKASNKYEAGSKEKFTGEVLSANLTDDVRLYHVIFTPAARTHWHAHSEGQTLIITSGIGWLAYKEEGKIFKKVLSAGESFYFKPGLEHWHGASPGGVMEHFAITRGVTEWKYPVTEEEYYTDSDHDITKELTNLAYAFSDAEKRGDRTFFDNHLAEDLIFRRASGKIANKKSFMEALEKLQYEYNIPGNVQVFPAVDKLSAAVSLTVSAKIIGESIIEGNWKNIRLFKFSAGRWQLTGWYNELL